MNAKEARQKSDQFNTSEANAAVAEARKAISNAVEDGAYSATIYKTLPSAAVDMLKRDGFEVNECHDPRGEDSTTITW